MWKPSWLVVGWGVIAVWLASVGAARGQDAKPAFVDKTLSEVVALVGENTGKVVVLTFFASWDSNSQKHFEMLEQLAKRYETLSSSFAMIAVSLDSNPQQLERYLAAKRRRVEVVRLSTTDGEENPLDQINVHYTHRVPFVAVLDDKGNCAVEWDGVQPVLTIVGYVDALLKAKLTKDKAEPPPPLSPPPKSTKSTMLTLKLPGGEVDPEQYPAWLPYAIGAVVMGVVLLIGLIVHVRS
jgi:thiol-disulfide isomerase/thioredoxin